LIALAQQSLASVLVNEYRPAEALPLAKSAFEFYRSGGFRSESVESLTVLVQAQRDLDDLRGAEESGRGLLKLAKELNESVSTMYAEDAVGSVFMLGEHYREALDHFQSAVAAGREVNQPVANYLVECADAQWRLGDYEGAKTLLASLPAGSQASSGIGLYVKEVTSAMLVSEKRYAEAKDIASRALAGSADSDPGFFYRVLAQVETAAGSPKRALAWAQKALSQAKSESDNYATATSNLTLANAYLAGGMSQGALLAAESAHDYFASSGRRESEYLSLLSLAKIHQSLDDVENSKKFAHEGLDILAEFNHNWVPQYYKTYLGRPDVREVSAELERIGRQ
jgi:tetratricopeptide (TPR) repeat protein